MNKNEEWEKMKQDYKEMKVPENGRAQMESTIRRAKMDKKREHRKKVIRNFGIGLAAALALVVLPNTNENIAYAMEKIPVIGGIFKVVTIRDFNQDDGHNMAKVEVPKVVEENTENTVNSEAVEKLNKSMEEYTNELVEKFKSEMNNEGFRSLDVTYETITDTDSWFTLVIHGFEAKASGYEFNRFYHIDKKTGQLAALKDLFQDGADYKAVISEEILKQMKAQMETEESIYFITKEDMDPFTSITDDQNFYFNADGNIVIAFNEYEVGPGYIGAPEFVIPSEVVSSILK